MLSKISGERVIKGCIIDYSKIKSDFKQMLSDNGFRWRKEWERQNAYGREGVWLNPITKASIRIRWGVLHPNAIVYIEEAMKETIIKFLNGYVYAVMVSPNEDYDILNKGLDLNTILGQG